MSFVTACHLALLALLMSPLRTCSGRVVRRGKAPPPNPWTLLWSDEFDATALNTNIWDVQTGSGCEFGICGWGNNEQQVYSSNNVYLSNGNLVIEARQEVAGNVTQFTSGRIRSFKAAGRGFSVGPSTQWKTVKIEARIMLPAGEALWPAFWMLPEDPAGNWLCSGCGAYGWWPKSGEIDIMEAKNKATQVTGTLHYGEPYTNKQGFKSQKTTFAGAYQTFGIQWTASEIRWYLNGNQYFKANSDDVASGGWFTSGGTDPNAPFNKPFHMLFNLALGGSFTGYSDPAAAIAALKATLPLGTTKQMLVDWVRVSGAPTDGYLPM